MLQNQYCLIHPESLNTNFNLDSLSYGQNRKWLCIHCSEAQFNINCLSYTQIFQRYIDCKDELIKNYLIVIQYLKKQFYGLCRQDLQGSILQIQIVDIFQEILKSPIEDQDLEKFKQLEQTLKDESSISENDIVSAIMIEDHIFQNQRLKNILYLLENIQNGPFEEVIQKIKLVASRPSVQRYEYQQNRNIINVFSCNQQILVQEFFHGWKWGLGALKIVNLNGQTVKEINQSFSHISTVLIFNYLFIAQERKLQGFNLQSNQLMFSLHFGNLSHINRISIYQTYEKSQFLLGLNKNIYHFDMKRKKLISIIKNVAEKFIYDQNRKIILVNTNNRLIILKIQNKLVISSIKLSHTLQDWLLVDQSICVRLIDNIYLVNYDKQTNQDQERVVGRLIMKNVCFMTTNDDLRYLIILTYENSIKIFDHSFLQLKSVYFGPYESIGQISVSKMMDSFVLMDLVQKITLKPSILELILKI